MMNDHKILFPFPHDMWNDIPWNLEEYSKRLQELEKYFGEHIDEVIENLTDPQSSLCMAMTECISESSESTKPTFRKAVTLESGYDKYQVEFIWTPEGFVTRVHYQPGVQVLDRGAFTFPDMTVYINVKVGKDNIKAMVEKINKIQMLFDDQRNQEQQYGWEKEPYDDEEEN